VTNSQTFSQIKSRDVHSICNFFQIQLLPTLIYFKNNQIKCMIKFEFCLIQEFKLSQEFSLSQDFHQIHEIHKFWVPQSLSGNLSQICCGAVRKFIVYSLFCIFITRIVSRSIFNSISINIFFIILLNFLYPNP